MVDYFQDRRYSFETDASVDGGFEVVNFKGIEGLSRLYEFDITLMSGDGEVQPSDMLTQKAVLYLDESKNVPIKGVLSSFELQREVDGNFFYRAVLVPRVWHLTLYQSTRVFLSKTLDQIIEEVLESAGLTSSDYKLELSMTYPEIEYVCQCQETHFNFISRWMEKAGMYYFFEQTAAGDVMVITDSRDVHQDVEGEKTIHYLPPTGMETDAGRPSLTSFIWRQKPIPNKISVQTFNYESTTPFVAGEAFTGGEAQAAGSGGEVYYFGEELEDEAQANDFAAVRAEEILCRQKMFYGEGGAFHLRVGYYFEITGHYRDEVNREYLLTSIEHEGSQAALLMSGLRLALSEEERRAFYRNKLEAIPHDVQFRAARVTPKPRFFGHVNAVVGADGSGNYAEIDDQGRYKVLFAFDRSASGGSKASGFVPMAQPYAGPNEGFHFPLRKNADVIVSFVDGDPDRPVISGVLPDALNPNVVIDQNSTINSILSAGGNKMEMEDQSGQQRIYMYSPPQNTHLQLGAPNPEIQLHTDQDGQVTIDNNAEVTIGNDMTESIGNNLTTDVGSNHNETVGSNHTHDVGGNHDQDVGGNQTVDVVGTQTVTVTGNQTVNANAQQSVTVAQDQTITAATNRTITVGANETTTIGANYALTVGGNTSITVGGNSVQFTTGSQNSAYAGPKYSVFIGPLFELSLGTPYLKLTGGIGIDIALAMRLGINIALSLTMGTVDIKSKKMTMKDYQFELKNPIVKLDTGGFKLKKPIEITTP